MFDAVLALTRFDGGQIEELMEPAQRERLRSKTGTAVHVLPTGVDPSFFERAPAEEEPGSVLFVGSFAADFNVDAVRYLVRDIFPLVRESLPEAQLYIAGGDAPPEVASYGELPGVTYLGLQRDLRQALGKAAVFVVPLRFAGGIRVRTLEAMAMGKAVVTTSVGIRGIEVTDGREVVIADGAGELAAGIVRVLRDRELRQRLGRAARELVMSRYDMERARREALELFERLGQAAARKT
jgi:glycosyltransferase involved in cell wall biosynthesis